jgi:ribosomal protein S12 methylthiotransferase
LSVLLDKPVDGASNSWIGRSYADAPDVDACVFVTPSEDLQLKAGDLVECEIVSSKEYDLIGVAMRVMQ